MPSRKTELISLPFSSMSKPLPNYIRTFRRKADLSQNDLARLLGRVSGSTPLRHEDYQRVPLLETVLRYAAIFRTDPRELFAGFYAKESEVVKENARQLLRELDASTASARKISFLRVLAEEEDMYYEPCEE